MSKDSNLQAPWVGQPPDEYGERVVRFTCNRCGEYIYEGDTYYDFDGERICEDCISLAKTTA